MSEEKTETGRGRTEAEIKENMRSLRGQESSCKTKKANNLHS
jgi:hypothetical protein